MRSTYNSLTLTTFPQSSSPMLERSRNLERAHEPRNPTHRIITSFGFPQASNCDASVRGFDIGDDPNVTKGSENSVGVVSELLLKVVEPTCLFGLLVDIADVRNDVGLEAVGNTTATPLPLSDSVFNRSLQVRP